MTVLFDLAAVEDDVGAFVEADTDVLVGANSNVFVEVDHVVCEVEIVLEAPDGGHLDNTGKVL